MAVYKRDMVDINLETGNIHRSFLKHSIGYKDAAADHFGIRVFRNGEPVNLTGVSVQGIFMPPQGDPIAITSGNIISENEAEVVLPQACYNYDGQFTLSIKLVDATNAVTGTMRIVDGMVDNTHASGTVAPVAAIPSYQEVLSTYEQAIAAINKTVRFDATQSLTDTQKATARSNISAPSVAEMNTAMGNEATARQNADALKVNISDIENDLTGTAAGKVLDARQGKVLDDKITAEAATRAAADSDLKSAIANNDYSKFANTIGYYVDNNGDLQESSVLRCSDFVYIPDDAITITEYVYYTNSSNVLKTFTPICVLYNKNKELLGYKNANGHVDGYRTFEPTSGGERAVYIRFNQSNRDADANNCLVRFNLLNKTEVDNEIDTVVPGIINNKTGFLGNFTGAFSTTEVLSTGITVKANTSYKIVNKTQITGNVNVYGSGNTSNAKRMTPYQQTVIFTNDNTDRELLIYNIGGGLDNIDINVYEYKSIESKLLNVPEVYYVSKTSVAGQYTSLTQCLLDLKDNRNEKIIYINHGTYDIYQEYVDANIPVHTGSSTSDYWDYNVWIPENTHIIGIGIVKLQWMPNPATNPITVSQCRAVSPVNVAGSMTLENVEVHCSNGRYCIHDDPNGQAQFTGAIKKYINVRCYKYNCDRDDDNNRYGFVNTIGFGLDDSMNYEFENCYLWNEGTGYAFYVHSRQTVGGSTLQENRSSELIVKNTVCDTQRTNASTKLGNSGSSTNLRIRTAFYNCYLGKGIDIINETGSGENPNAFDVTLVNCGDVPITITDSDNPYPPKIYPPVV